MNRHVRLFELLVRGAIVCFCLLGILVSANAQQWITPHSSPVFLGTPQQEQARSKQARLAKCLANLAQLDLACRLYGGDYNDRRPVRWQDCQNYLSNPAYLICPDSPWPLSDTNWNQFDFSRVSYQLLTNTGFAQPVIICNYHGTCVRGDGLRKAPKSYALFPGASNGVPVPPGQALLLGRKKANEIACINNLKQIEFACLIYDGSNKNAFPDNLDKLGYNELGSPEVLFCPAGNFQNIPTDFSQVNYSNISYTLSPATILSPPETPHITCRFHGNYSRVDGSVIPGPDPLHYPGIIQGHPINQTAEPGSTARFTILPTPSPTSPAYQWYREQPFDSSGEPFTNAIPIPGATNAALQIVNCSAQDEGYYDVIVTVQSGRSETSAMAYLAVQNLDSLKGNTTLERQCCSNNLWQLFITAKIASENQQFPVDVDTIADSLGWPMALYCPADTNRTPPESWDALIWSNISYIIDTNAPADGSAQILARCKIHNSFIRANGEITFPQPLSLMPLAHAIDKDTLAWTGGSPPYQVEAATTLNPPDWHVIASNLETPIFQVSASRNTVFYRVSWQIH